MFELVHFSIKIISNTCTVVLNMPKVHEIIYLKILWHFSLVIIADFQILYDNMIYSTVLILFIMFRHFQLYDRNNIMGQTLA